MADLLKDIKARRSVRSYKSEPVDEAIVEKVIEAGLYAASGMNRQDSIIISVSNKELRDRLSRLNAAVMGASDRDPFYGAPNVLVVLTSMENPNRVYDGSLVIGNMLLEAHSLGIGSCWIHRAKEVFQSEEGKKILAELGVTGEYEGIGNVILGYVDGEYPAEKERVAGRVYYAK